MCIFVDSVVFYPRPDLSVPTPRPELASRFGVPNWGGVRVPNELFIKVQVACFTLCAHCVHTCTRVYSCVFRRGVSASRLGLRANRVYPKGSGPEKLIEVW